jgi:hypothetical protein
MGFGIKRNWKLQRKGIYAFFPIIFSKINKVGVNSFWIGQDSNEKTGQPLGQPVLYPQLLIADLARR